MLPIINVLSVAIMSKVVLSKVIIGVVVVSNIIKLGSKKRSNLLQVTRNSLIDWLVVNASKGATALSITTSSITE
jgi:hypothetical protein